MKKSLAFLLILSAAVCNAQETDNINENNNLFWNHLSTQNPAFTAINGNRIDYRNNLYNSKLRKGYSQFLGAEVLSKNQKHAFSLRTQSVHFGNYNSFGYSASYAHSFKLRNNNELRLGTDLSYTNRFSSRNSDVSDVFRMNEVKSSIGVAYKSKNTRIGLAAGVPLYFSGEGFSPSNPNLRFSFGQHFKLGKNLNLVAHGSILFNKDDFNRNQLIVSDLALDLIYKKKYFLRLGGTTQNNIGLEAGILINDKLKLSYSTNIDRPGVFRRHSFGVSLRF